ncbi:MAG: amidohydrolase family protein [Chloroflexi bacterium]|nr:amidohydrolase family protein [Chloroflexota bacterium]
MKSSSVYYPELREYVAGISLVDCHDHSCVVGPKVEDAIQFLVGGYFESDLQSASSPKAVRAVLDAKRPLAERWPEFEAIWRRTCHTGYAQVVRRVLQHFFGQSEMSLAALEHVQANLPNIGDPAMFDGILEEAKIAARLEDCWADANAVLAGTYQLSPRGRLIISLVAPHSVRDFNAVQSVMAPLGRHVTTLDEYLEGCCELFTAFKNYGAVAFKDQSAYTRTLAYQNPTRAEAEAAFNWIMADPRRVLSYPEGSQPLDDYLFHCFMRMARDLDLPVQIHTGHMAGIRNDIVKTNAIWLTSLIELHQETRFDLFHANWPYAGELLYLGKNYPNVTLDFCWANIIDPIYCQQLFKQALSSVPHAKVHGYGSDYFGGGIASAWAHADITRDNIAIALAEMVADEYMSLDEAKEVAYGWMYSNANAFFRLGLPD